MPERANVSSIEAIEAFRANLLVYISKVRPVLEEISADVLRTRIWLENDQRTLWENQCRRRGRELQEAQQALFSARLSNLRDESTSEIAAVHRAKLGVQEAEEKLRHVKLWNRDFESRVQPLLKQIEKLQTLYSSDLVHAAAQLSQVIRILDAYHDAVPTRADSASAPGAISRSASEDVATPQSPSGDSRS